MAVLVSEIQGLERLIAATPRTGADRPALIFRAANDYSEMAVRASTERAAAQARKDKTAEAKFHAQASAARKRAIALFTSLRQDSPTFEKPDEVLYYLAIELAASGNADAMRAALTELVEKHPESALAEDAREALAR